MSNPTSKLHLEITIYEIKRKKNKGTGKPLISNLNRRSRFQIITKTIFYTV